MKKVVILHGTGNNHTGNWFPWLKAELEKTDYQVWVPDLPDADKPNVERYTKFLLSQNWDFNDNVVIGHSSGAVEVLHLLENLPAKARVDAAIMVAVFTGSLGWEALSDLEGIEFDLNKIKEKADKLIVIHSDDDPNCPIEGAREIADKLGAEMITMHGMKHFSIGTDPRFTKFPELLEIIKQKVKPE
jgi:predicted alpha/beta hydrolase family esterase